MLPGDQCVILAIRQSRVGFPPHYLDLFRGRPGLRSWWFVWREGKKAEFKSQPSLLIPNWLPAASFFFFGYFFLLFEWIFSFKIAEKAKLTSTINKDHFPRFIKQIIDLQIFFFIRAISIPGRNIFFHSVL